MESLAEELMMPRNESIFCCAIVFKAKQSIEKKIYSNLISQIYKKLLEKT